MTPAVAPRPTAPQYQIPAGVFVDIDAESGAQWTNVAGAMVLAQKSRRTIYLWMKKSWVVVRRTAGSRPLILVSSLWQDAEIHSASAAPVEGAK